MKKQDKARNKSILRLLDQAPSTSRELSDLLKLPLRHTQVGLWILKHAGYVAASGRIGRMKLWAITPRGQREKRLRQ